MPGTPAQLVLKEALCEQLSELSLGPGGAARGLPRRRPLGSLRRPIRSSSFRDDGPLTTWGWRSAVLSPCSTSGAAAATVVTTSCTSRCSEGRHCLTTAVKQWPAVGPVPVPLRTRGWHGVGFFKYPQGCTMAFWCRSTSQAGTRWVETCMVHALCLAGCGTLLQTEVAPPRFSRVVGVGLGGGFRRRW